MARPDEDESATEADGGALDQLKRQAREARQAARRAAADKEAEMIKDWEETRHQSR